ncbi:hypothetical protein [Porphyromonas cangingivalis]|uniref:hypothetical protein n=1 Tax=Porphyromonas cangingivalis TaxID=36874 RepID=UPI000A8B4C2B|nr:hypothetical protein [Porphyromonas cangingivalis]
MHVSHPAPTVDTHDSVLFSSLSEIILPSHGNDIVSHSGRRYHPVAAGRSHRLKDRLNYYLQIISLFND